MAGLKNIKAKIQSVQKTRQVTKAMEAVSAVKMRKTQEQALQVRPYAAAALSILERISDTVDARRHPLMHEQAGKTGVVVITSDKGLAGSLNSSVIRTVERELAQRDITSQECVMLCIGRRGADYFEARGFTVAYRVDNATDDINVADMQELTERIRTLHREHTIGACILAYTNFRSTFEQEPLIRQLIPIQPALVREMVTGIAPTKVTYAGGEVPVGAPPAYTFEPNADTVLSEVLPRLVGAMLYHALAEAKASEHSARMVAMKSATDKAGELSRDLTLAFNKARQAAITAEVSEITSGIEAMR